MPRKDPSKPLDCPDFILVGPGPSSCDLWPVIRMADGSLRKGPHAEIVGRAA